MVTAKSKSRSEVARETLAAEHVNQPGGVAFASSCEEYRDQHTRGDRQASLLVLVKLPLKIWLHRDGLWRSSTRVDNVDTHLRISGQPNYQSRLIGLVTTIRIGGEMRYEVGFKINLTRSLNVSRRYVEDG